MASRPRPHVTACDSYYLTVLCIFIGRWFLKCNAPPKSHQLSYTELFLPCIVCRGSRTVNERAHSPAISTPFCTESHLCNTIRTPLLSLHSRKLQNPGE